MTGNNSMMSIEKLTGRDNWASWSFAVKAYLQHEDLYDCVLKPPEASDPASLKQDTKAKSKLILLVDPILYVHIQEAQNAKQVWDKLAKAFEDSGLTRKVGLLRELINTNLENSVSVEDYVNKIMTAAHKLRNIKFNVDDEWLGTLMLAGLPEMYRPMIMGLESSGMEISADLVKNKLLQEVKTSDTTALYTNTKKFQPKSDQSKNKKGPRCFNCNKYGHLSKNCWHKKTSNNEKNEKKTGYVAAFSASIGTDSNCWHVDSGASMHMTMHRDWLTDIRPSSVPSIRIANNKVLKVECCGNVCIKVNAKDGSTDLIQDSLPHPKFEETFEAFDDSAVCPQIEEFNGSIVGNLDCLHLNVFVPTEATSSNRLPVVVWIHGGGFESGFYNRYVYGPKFLVRHSVVLVTINYRLGPYGFMCTDIPEVSGNQGLKDQQKALRWVKENIEAFGGDSNRITILGESAGGASVDLHLYSAQENLFHQAIMQSGVSLGPWVMLNPEVEGPLKLAGYLGLITNDLKEALSFLASADPKLVIAATDELGLNFRPCVEKQFDNVESFIKDYPVNMIVPKVKTIPLLIGFNEDEGLVFNLNTDFEKQDIVEETINSNFEVEGEKFNEMYEVLKHFYFGDKDAGEETRRGAINLDADLMFVHPTQRSLKKYFNNGAKTIFSYMFSYVSERNFGRYNNGITVGGATHADEISYLFDVSYMKSVMSEEDQIVVDRITTLWTNFVKYGDPTPERTELLPIKWAPTTVEHWNYLNIDRDLAMASRPFSERLAFLDLFFMTYEKLQIGYGSVE